VVTDWSRLPWSVAYGGAPSPHWILVIGHEADRWRVVDQFDALVAGRQQTPHDGWLDRVALSDAMSLPESWSEPQQRRNEFAFGPRLQVPATKMVWIERAIESSPSTEGEDWVLGAAALDVLVEVASGDGLPRWMLDDLWAAAGHHCFSYAWRAARAVKGRDQSRIVTAAQCWQRLPQVLRVAEVSGDRGRPRTSLAQLALRSVRDAEQALRCAS
jgi:hypothetical protein